MNTTKFATIKKAALALLAALVATASLHALTIEDLRNDTKLTPKRFARYFSEFEFERHVEVQKPAVFLASRRGDCDDYATLAAQILKEKGYTTHLFAIRMAHDVHVVCYVEETKCYLDFNNRVYLIRTAHSNGNIEDIAKRVASSFDTTWSSASEFTFDGSYKRLVKTVFTPTAGGSTMLTQAR